MTAGHQLVLARLDRGWSQEEIAERLQVSVAHLAAVENTDDGQLPSRSYLRDLVSEYARAVGLDPQQMENRYLADLDVLAVRPHTSQLEDTMGATDGTADPPLVSRHNGAVTRVDGLSQFVYEAELNAALQAGGATPDDGLSEFVSEAELNAGHRSRESLGQSLAPVSPDAAPAAVVPPAHTRPVDPVGSAAPAPQATPDGREPDDNDVFSLPLPPDGVDMPPLRHGRRRSDLRYVTGAGAAIIGIAALVYLGGVTISQTGADDAHSSAAAATVTDRRPRGATAPPIDPPLVAPTAGSAAAAEPVAAQAYDVSGRWHLTNRVESANYSRFKNMTLGFQLTLERRGTQIVGEGYKFSENGKRIRSPRRTSLALEGRLEGERLVLNFTERGAARSSAGRLVLHVADDGSLRGRFTSDAARSSGSSIALRQRPGM